MGSFLRAAQLNKTGSRQKQQGNFAWPATRSLNWTSKSFPPALGATLLWAAIAACGYDIDYDDELGVEGSPQSAEYELVVIDGDKGEESSRRRDSIASSRGSETDGATGEGTEEGLILYDDEGEFTVQVGLYASSRQAGERVRELSTQGYPAYAIAVPSGGGFRLRIGYFKTHRQAERFGEIFKKDTGADYWIDRRTNEML